MIAPAARMMLFGHARPNVRKLRFLMTDYSDLLREEETKLPPNTRALFLTHATVFAPGAYRISSLFEQLHRSFRTPTVLFYPGTWNHTLNYMGLRSDDQAL
ncbi:MAG TPA: hypothetical protein VE030_00620, partial [Burkholderiales bacterium]|nr:hypothetical protein [Burkholderiales bacterium]